MSLAPSHSHGLASISVNLIEQSFNEYLPYLRQSLLNINKIVMVLEAIACRKGRELISQEGTDSNRINCSSIKILPSNSS